MMNKDKNSDGMDELREAAKEAAKWYKENPPGRLRFTMLMAEDVVEHSNQLIMAYALYGPVQRATIFHDAMLDRFEKTFGEPE